MLTRRCLVAACAALLTNAALYPLDTRKVAAQLRVRATPRGRKAYAGLGHDSLSTFSSTACFFFVYEAAMLEAPRGVLAAPWSAMRASAVAGLVATPLSALKRRRQAKAMGVAIPTKLTARMVAKAYLTDLARVGPKSLVKYSVYEPLMFVLMLRVPLPLAAALAAVTAATVATTICHPLDVAKTRLVVSATQARGLFSGWRMALLLSALTNGCGHVLLEVVAPRG